MMLEFIVTGFSVGLLVGLTGMGAGLVMTPLLIFFFGVPPATAIGTDLVYAGITKLFGFVQHLRQRTVDLFTVRWLIAASAPGALLGVGVIRLLHMFSQEQAERWLSKMLGITFVLVACLMLMRIFLSAKQTSFIQDFLLKTGTLTKRKLLALGCVGGFLVGMTSVGSGSVFIAALSMVGRFSPAVLVGTDVAHGALLTLSAALGHIVIGDVDYAMAGQLLLGSIPGIILGSRLTVSLPEKWVRSCLILILLLTGIKLL
ncbi:sulfite exporter TauE/SafE family protein [Bacillaceae bacterium]